ncbi:hypothetical protein AVEN_143517-1 [Araneus ventricosus]|uniref:Uncharacterized protein n=1 Tax=Araneus ventricosus TaxID=182803 RepID=A0A4Y2PFT3_ARAVE|nr:hypothetical protein AVEN_143517-1 [Araneus ventricosus]
MVSASASEPVDREFYSGLRSYSVFAIICNEFASSSSYGDLEACVNLLQACFTLALLSCHSCSKIADFQCKLAASLMQTKIAIWALLCDWESNFFFLHFKMAY